MRTITTLLAVLLVAACATSPAPQSPDVAPAISADLNAQFDKLAEDYYEEFLRENPLNATFIGDNRYNDRLEFGFTEESRERARALHQKYLEAMTRIDRSKLDRDRQLSYEIFVRARQQSLDSLQLPFHLAPVNQFGNFATSFVQLAGSGLHPFKTVKDYDDFLSRSRDFDRAVDIAIANMRQGIARGIVQPRVLMEKALPQIAAQVVDDVEKSAFYGPVKTMPATFAAADRERLTAAYREMVSQRLVPAYRRLSDFIRDEYIPKARTTVGLSALPEGEAWYRFLVRSTTTTDLTPERIHEIGLAEVARIHGEMIKVKDQIGFQGDLPAFFKHLQEDPKQGFDSREEMLAAYRDLQTRIDASTSRLFDVQPKANYEIRPVEPFRERSAAGGSYQAATPDGSRPGIFYLNTFDPKSRKRYGTESLLLHEGSPGHHFQISIQRELTTLPRFRRFGGYTAYAEGWGLYAESLGKDLGFYQDPYQHYGGLSGELWRAIRLVLDTGIHLKGWTREQAIEYALRNSSTSETSAVSEVERFIAIPSQALAYKIGELKIQELRRKAERELGARFDIKAFHRAVLEDGALPLDVLEQKIDRWIAEKKTS